MRAKLLAITALVASGVIVTAFFVQSLSSSNAQTQTRSRYLPEYTASGDLVLPKNFHEWVFVGSPLTPNALNGGKAGFPEYHNVYIEPGSYEIYKKTYGDLEKSLSPSPRESDSMTARGHGRMERASHGAEGLFRC